MVNYIKRGRIWAKRNRKKIEELQFKCKTEEKEKEEINGVLMQANDLLEYRNKIIKAFMDGTFSSEHLKESDNAAYNYVLKYVNKSIEEIKSMEEKIDLIWFKEFFESPSPANYTERLINTKNRNENKETVENRILDLKDEIKRMSEKEKKIKMQMGH